MAATTARRPVVRFTVSGSAAGGQPPRHARGRGAAGDPAGFRRGSPGFCGRSVHRDDADPGSRPRARARLPGGGGRRAIGVRCGLRPALPRRGPGRRRAAHPQRRRGGPASGRDGARRPVPHRFERLRDLRHDEHRRRADPLVAHRRGRSRPRPRRRARRTARTACAPPSASSTAPGACTRPGSSRPPASSWSCVRTSAATTPWTAIRN